MSKSTHLSGSGIVLLVDILGLIASKIQSMYRWVLASHVRSATLSAGPCSTNTCEGGKVVHAPSTTNKTLVLACTHVQHMCTCTPGGVGGVLGLRGNGGNGTDAF